MDTVTQITLGAAVGEAVLGRKIGNKAPLWGAAFGVLPDLDILVFPFVSEVTALAIHRGITHSFFFCIVASPIFGWLLSKYNRNEQLVWKDWSWMVFLVLLTHVFIDLFTSYGTQVLQPFSNYALSFNSIFIIDPFYTVPLAAGIITALFMDQLSLKRRRINYIGLLVSTIYLFSGLAVKAHVNQVFEQNFKTQDIHPAKYMTTPAPFSIFLWTAYAEENDTLYAGLYSVFDEDERILFHKISQNENLLKPYRDDLAVERLIWFSQGYYVVSETDSAMLVHDLRFGRSDVWLAEETAPFIWNYHLHFNNDSTRVTGFTQFEPDLNLRVKMFSRLIERISGKG